MSRRRRNRAPRRDNGFAIGWCTPENLPEPLVEPYRQAAARAVALSGQPPTVVMMDLPSFGVVVAVVTDEATGEAFLDTATNLAHTLGWRVGPVRAGKGEQ